MTNNHLDAADVAYQNYVEKLRRKGGKTTAETEPASEGEARQRYIQRLQGKGARGDSINPSGMHTDAQGRSFHTDNFDSEYRFDVSEQTHQETAFSEYEARRKKRKNQAPEIIERGIFIAL